MNYIGNVIREYRDMLGISRRQLSDCICTEKYVYMIENGERTPSSQITRLLGDKMGVDLFKYNEYLDCADPIGVNSAIESFNKFRRENNLTSLVQATEKAIHLQDFRKEPWIYEIELNRHMIKILGEGDFLNSINIIQDTIAKIEQNHPQNICIVNFYVLLSICFQMARDLKSAKRVIMLANDAIEGKQKIAKYAQVVISVKINTITMHYLAGELDSVIKEGIILNEYEDEMCCHERSHHAFFYLAFAYYQSGAEEEGIEWFLKALCATLIRQKTMDMYYLTSYEIFDVMIQDKRIPKGLSNRIKEKYGANKI